MTAQLDHIISVTGHRPDKLGGWKVPNPTYNAVLHALRETFKAMRPTMVISGMALGVDQWAAQVCIDDGIPFWAAVPFAGQEAVWPEYSRARYKYLLSRAAGSTIVSDGGWAASKMHIRNQWMVDRCHLLVAVWNGTPGGTASCVAYAEKVQRPIHFVHMNFPAVEPHADTPITKAVQQQSMGAALNEPKEKFSFKKEAEAPSFNGRILDLDD